MFMSFVVLCLWMTWCGLCSQQLVGRAGEVWVQTRGVLDVCCDCVNLRGGYSSVPGGAQTLGN